MTKFYLVVMRRWGDTNSHCYYLGLSKDKVVASIAGMIQRDYRGNKYEPKIIELERDEKKPLTLLFQFNQKNKYADKTDYYVTLMNDEEKTKIENSSKKIITEIRFLEKGDFLQVSDEEVLELMPYLSHRFNEEEVKYLKNRYEDIERKKIN